MIHEEICTYEVCKLAKEKGFNVQTFDWYDYTGNYHKGFIPHELHECPRYKEYYAPTQSLLQRWLREEKELHISIGLAYTWRIEHTRGLPLIPNGNENVLCMKIISTSVRWDECYGTFDTYEESLEDALKYALENLV